MSGIFINSDAWNFWLTTEDRMTRQGVIDDVDFYAVPGVEAVFYNMNFQRVFFPSKIFTPIWKDCELDAGGNLLLRGKKTEQDYKNLVFNSKKLWENVPDFMSLRYRRCHEKGVEMWHSMRMNDVHHTPLGQEHRPQHCDLWQERKDLIRAWYRHEWRGIWHDNAFDYGKEEVRKYHLAMAEEYLLGYESDGIELDFLRSIPLFRPGFDECSKDILTQFMRDIRATADRAEKKWGHKLRIAVRVPMRVSDAIGCGMDVPAWCREKLLDVLIPGPNNTSAEVDPQLELWRILAPAPVILAPCIDCALYTCGIFGMEFTEETDCGFASSFYQLGADTVYLYNHFPFMFSGRPYMQNFFQYASDRQAVAACARRHVLTRHDPVGEGKFRERYCPPEIWAHCCDGGIKINAGEGTAGRAARIVAGFAFKPEIDILLNTSYCEILPPETPLPGKMPEKEAYYIQARLPEGVLHDGWNSVEIFNKGERGILESEFLWLEIDVDRA